jgi:hypothetical protein
MPLDVHNYFVELIRNVTTVIAKGNYHPAARINAILLLGGLNSREAVLLGEPKSPPEPLIAALAFMLGEFENEQQPDGVKAACLAGMLRHVKLDRLLPQANRRLVGNTAESRIVDAMVKLLQQDQAPEGRSSSGHVWMRRRAAEILGWLGSTGGGEVTKELERIAADESQSVALRCDAAEALGRLNYGQNGAPSPADLAKKLGAVAVFACYHEIERVEEQQKMEEEREAASSPYGGYGGEYGGDYEESYGEDYGSSYEEDYGSSYGEDYGSSYGMMPGTEVKPFDPLGYRVHLTRRRIKSQLLSVREGLAGPQRKDEQVGGLLAATTEPGDQDYLKKVIAGIDAITTVIDEASQEDMETLLESIGTAVQDMEDSCEIVVNLGEDPLDEDFLSNPMDSEDELGVPLDGSEATPPLDAGPAGTPPAGPPIPAAGPGAGKPAAAPPAGPPTPAAGPGAGKPAAAPPAGPPIPAAAPGAGKPAAAPPAGPPTPAAAPAGTKPAAAPAAKGPTGPPPGKPAPAKAPAAGG